MKRQYLTEPDCDVATELDECWDDEAQMYDFDIPPKKRTKLAYENDNVCAVYYILFDFCLTCCIKYVY